MKRRSQASGGVSALMVLRTSRLLEARGVDPEPVFAQAGLSLEELAVPGARVSYKCLDALLEATAERVGAAGLGLELAGTRIKEAYGAAGLLLITSPNLRQGLARAFSYQRIWGDGERFVLRDLGCDAAVSFRHPGASALVRAVLAECALVEVMEGARGLVEPRAKPVRVEFVHEPFGTAQELVGYFGITPEFGCGENCMVLGQELMDRPIRMLRELLFSAVEEQCRSALRALPDHVSIATRVRALLTSSLESPPSLRQVAEKLRMSARTLERRLRADGTTFYELLDRERQARVQELVSLGRSLKEAALQVGFSDPSALLRARRRWSGRRSAQRCE